MKQKEEVKEIKNLKEEEIIALEEKDKILKTIEEKKNGGGIR